MNSLVIEKLLQIWRVSAGINGCIHRSSTPLNVPCMGVNIPRGAEHL